MSESFHSLWNHVALQRLQIRGFLATLGSCLGGASDTFSLLPTVAPSTLSAQSSRVRGIPETEVSRTIAQKGHRKPPLRGVEGVTISKNVCHTFRFVWKKAVGYLQHYSFCSFESVLFLERLHRKK